MDHSSSSGKTRGEFDLAKSFTISGWESLRDKFVKLQVESKKGVVTRVTCELPVGRINELT
jgi:hypothetical protein